METYMLIHISYPDEYIFVGCEEDCYEQLSDINYCHDDLKVLKMTPEDIEQYNRTLN